MIAKRYGLANDYGTTLNVTVLFTEPDDITPIDLTGFTAYFNVKDKTGDPVLLSHNPELTSSGEILIHIEPEITSLFPLGTHSYQLDLHSPNGDIDRLLYGPFIVRSGSNG